MEKELHPRSLHNEKYDFEALIQAHPKLSSFVKKNKYDVLAVDYSDANAVLSLNQALLAYHYKVLDWSIPKGHLCPPIPGRADYIHYIADLLGKDNGDSPPVGTKVKGLDIGTGTGCIYPILGNSIYGWKFIGSEISNDAINNAKVILRSNPSLKKNIKIRFQPKNNLIFETIIKPEEKFDFTMCNPPFYSSLEEANSSSDRKVKNLNINRVQKGSAPINKNKPSNFGGAKAELWCPGGEVAFIKKMIKESATFKSQCRWFTTLVSNKTHLEDFYPLFEASQVQKTSTIEMHQGQKISHLLAWQF